MITERVRLVAEALYWRRAYENSSPEVGFGPMMATQLDRILRDTHVKLTADEERLVITRVKQMEQK